MLERPLVSHLKSFQKEQCVSLESNGLLPLRVWNMLLVKKILEKCYNQIAY
nr:MAG TPA: hypothetical protein [Caudoviricetes sp.]